MHQTAWQFVDDWSGIEEVADNNDLGWVKISLSSAILLFHSHLKGGSAYRQLGLGILAASRNRECMAPRLAGHPCAI